MKIARYMLVSAIVLLGCHCARPGFISFLGVDPRWYLGVLAMAMLVFASRLYRNALGAPPSTPMYNVHLKILAVVIILLAAYGYLNGNVIKQVLLDTSVMIIVWCFLFIGRYDRVWKDLETPLFVVTIVSALVVLISLNRPEVFITEDGIQFTELGRKKGRWTTETLAYQLRPLLFFAPILFALSFNRVRWDWQKFAGFFSLLLVFGLAIHFWKRAPTVRTLGYLFMVILLNAKNTRRVQMGRIVLIGLGGMIALALVGSRIEGLLNRFENADQNSRFEEASLLFDDYGTFELLFGRGMGGGYRVPAYFPLTDIISRSGQIGRLTIHIGVFWPLIKGGLVLSVVYFAFFFRWFCYQSPQWGRNRYNFTAAAILPILCGYWLIGTMPSMSSAFNAVVIGMCAARLAVPADGCGIRSISTYVEKRGSAFIDQAKLSPPAQAFSSHLQSVETSGLRSGAT